MLKVLYVLACTGVVYLVSSNGFDGNKPLVIICTGIGFFFASLLAIFTKIDKLLEGFFTSWP